MRRNWPKVISLNPRLFGSFSAGEGLNGSQKKLIMEQDSEQVFVYLPGFDRPRPPSPPPPPGRPRSPTGGRAITDLWLFISRRTSLCNRSTGLPSYSRTVGHDPRRIVQCPVLSRIMFRPCYCRSIVLVLEVCFCFDCEQGEHKGLISISQFANVTPVKKILRNARFFRDFMD